MRGRADNKNNAKERGDGDLLINVNVIVPDGEICEGCNLWYRAEDKDCYCLLFDMTKLEQRYKSVHGLEILKCQQCKSVEVLRNDNKSD